ncbi:MAG: molecular chaperone TorD family protein [archaeon]|nr:molecular chaperone TorD family protein [archaeon]
MNDKPLQGFRGQRGEAPLIEEILEIRRNFYAFLYRLYVEAPPRELADDLVNERFHFQELSALNISEELSQGFRMINEFMKKSKGKEVDALHEDLVQEYTRLFIGPFKLPVQPYEAWWVSGHLLGEPLVKVKAFYRKAGIAKSSEYKEPEDHIAFELKFMHYLCEEGLAADTRERLKECLQLQREFLDEHILKWVPAFCDALYNYERSDFYKGIAKLTKGFILLEDAVVKDLVESAR